MHEELERYMQRAVTKAREAAREAASSDHIDLGYEDIVADAIIDACQRSLVEQGLLLVPREAAWVLERLGPRQKKKGDAGG